MLIKAGKILACMTCSEKSSPCPENEDLLKHIQQWVNEHTRLTGHYNYEVR